MSSSVRALAALSVSVFALALPDAAFAQASSGAGNDNGEIVITAQKRTEKLQDVPVSASVVSGKALEQQHVTDLSDINKAVPSVEIKGTFNGRVP